MNDEDFKHIVLDYFGMIATERHREIMTSNQDVMNEITKLTAAHAQLEATVHTAIADAGVGGDVARASFVSALQSAQAQIAKTEAELATAIAAMSPPPPSQPPVPVPLTPVVPV